MVELYFFLAISLCIVYAIINGIAFIKHPIYPLLFLLFFWMFPYIFSNILIERGVYLFEIAQTTYFTGSTLRLILYDTIFLLGIFFCFFLGRRTIKQNIQTASYASYIVQKRHITLAKHIYISCLIILLILLLNAAISPSPWINPHVNRFNYWEYATIPFLSKIFGGGSIPIVVALGIIFHFYTVTNNHIYKRRTLILFVLFIVYQLLLGQKFTAISNASIIFFTPMWSWANTVSKRWIKRFWYIVSISIVLGVLMSYAVFFFYSYISTNAEYFGQPLQYIMVRLASQGQVYWAIDNIVINGGNYGLNYLQHLVAFNFVSMPVLMYLIAPYSIVDTYLFQGIRYSGGYPAIALLIFGPYITSFLQFTFGMMFGWLAINFHGSLVRFKLLNSCAYSMILSILLTVFIMGDFNLFISIKFIIPAIYLLFSRLLLVHRRA